MVGGYLDLYTLEPRPLITELFARGFRRTKRLRMGGRGLWHPKLHIGVNIDSFRTPLNLAELSNVLTVINDLDHQQRGQTSLKVIGIEDLIATQIMSCLTRRTPLSETASQIHVLVALGREGVGGRFRAGYLHRRVTWAAGGVVVIEGELPGQAVECDPAPRYTMLSRMQALIEPWHVRWGLSFDRPSLAAECLGSGSAIQTDRSRNQRREGQGGAEALAQNIVPFDAAWPVLSR